MEQEKEQKNEEIYTPQDVDGKVTVEDLMEIMKTEEK